MLASVKLPPSTSRLVVGSLCLCACALPVFVGDELETSTGGEMTSSSGVASPTTGGTTGGESTGVAVSEGGDSTTGETTAGPDMPAVDPPLQCQLPADACDADDDDLGRALGLGCGTLLPSEPLAFAGPPESRAVTTGLGASFVPRLGSRAVILSTGVAAEVPLAIDDVMEQSDCSQVGLPCPSTDFPAQYDLAVLPAPIDPQPVMCPEGQVPPDGDCSGTVAAQWLGDPQIAHDYTELRFSVVVPDNTIAVALSLAFLTAERPKRFPGGYNDFFIAWLDSERWTGNIAIHPEQGVPIAADVLEFAYTSDDPEIADFAFAEHAATDWFTIAAPVEPGETITLVLALFDESDGAADSAVLVDDLRWECTPVNLDDEPPPVREKKL